MTSRRPVPFFKAAQPKPPSKGRWLFTLVVLVLFGVGTGMWWATIMAPPADFVAEAPAGTPSRPPELPSDAIRHYDETLSSMPWSGANLAIEPAIARAAFRDGAFRKGELVVRASNPAELAAIIERAQKAGGTLLGTIADLNAARFSFPDVQSASNFARSGNGTDEQTLQMDLNFTVKLPVSPPPVDPNAPGSLVPFGNKVMDYLGVPQDNAGFGKGILLAVLDTGLSPGASNLLAGTGHFEQLDYVGGDSPAVGHGDRVASLLAGMKETQGRESSTLSSAFTGSEIGNSQGIAPGADLLSVRVLDSNNEGDVFTVAEGIYEATKRGARVISLSLGTDQPSTILQDAVSYALGSGIVVVAATGNDGVGAVSYPAAFDGVIAVGAVDATGRRATFSNYGPELTLSAPGVGISTVVPTGTANFSGTSAAAPLVAGAIADLLATNQQMSGTDAVNLLTKYSNYAGPVTTTGTNDYYGSGVLALDRVLNRNDSSFVDLAVADLYLNLAGLDTSTLSDSATVPLQISVQNRGNSYLSSVQLEVGIDMTQKSYSIPGLAVGQVKAVTVPVSVGLLRTTGVTVGVTASTFGQTDARADNNFMGRTMRLVSTAAGTK